MTLALALLAACGGSGPPAPKAVDRPNIVLFSLDTVRADALRVYGNTVSQTPVIDQLANEATRFTRAYTVTPLTIPAHSSLFTGLYPPRHGVRDNLDYRLGDSAVTLAERLQDAGWQTMASVGAEVTTRHWGFAQGFDAYFDDMGQDPDAHGNRWRVERRGDAVVDDALGWLASERDAARPFFAWIHLFDAHFPYEPPDTFAATAPDYPYLGEVAWVDFQVGRVLAALEAAGHLDDTWVVVLGDHGEGLGSHGEGQHGVLLYNATTRVPLLVRPPGGRAGPGTVDFPASLVDVLPTVLGAAGLPAATDVDGIDLGPWVVDPKRPPPDAERGVYVESLYGFHHYGWSPLRALVTPGFKAIDSTTPELYARADSDDVTDLAKGVTPPELGPLLDRVRAMGAAMEPMPDIASQSAPDADRLAQLEALGYLTSVAQTTGDGWGEGLPDPVKKLGTLRRLEHLRALLRTGKVDEARAVAEALVVDEPGLTEAQSTLAQIRRAQGDIEGAIALYQAIDEARPSAQARLAMGKLLGQTGQPRDGLALLSSAVEIDPYSASGWTAYLHALFLIGDLQALRTEVDRARGLLPGLAAVDAMDGVLLAMAGDREGAESLLRGVLAREPDHPFVNQGLGILARSAGDADEAETYFLEELRLAPRSLSTRRLLVELYAEEDRYAEQLAQLDVIAAADPADALTRNARGQALFNLRRYDEALVAIDECLALEPRSAACMLLRANALKKLGRQDEAAAAWAKAQELDRLRRAASNRRATE